MDFSRVNSEYLKLFNSFGDSPKSVMIPKDNQHLRFESIARFIDSKSSTTYLDYGCGLSHQLEYFKINNFSELIYSGVDINQEFISYSKLKFPDYKFFHRDNFIMTPHTYDYVGVVGTFGLVYSSLEAHKTFIFEEIKHLWQRTDKVLFLNFMSTVVDYTQENAYHQELGELYEFIARNLSRKIIVVSDYLPYEYTCVVFR